MDQRRWLRRGELWVGLGGGLALAAGVGALWARVPAGDLAPLGGSLLATGLASAALGAAGVRWLRRGLVPIWLQIILTYLFGVGVALCNILVTAQLMFIATRDLPLLALLLLFAAAIATGLGAALAHVFARRVAALSRGAAAIAAGDLTARVPMGGYDELAALGRSFNHMADQLAAGAAERERQEAARRELVAAISHDLRTPLASLRAMTEALADGVVDDAATTARYYETMRAQIGLVDRLIADMFSLARLEAGAMELDLAPVDLGQLAADALAGHSPQAAAQGVHLEAQVVPGVRAALVSAQEITRVVDNLVTNALRHTSAGGRVTVRVEPAGAAMLAVEVADTGEGIAPEDLPRVFERFYRGEKSRSRASGGAGLGLAIARGIVEAHGGTISIDSAPGIGTRVRFTVPGVASGRAGPP